ncbi:MAG: methyltransferase domain-containing protein [Acidobacteriota bacterium]|nr:methyltransferase domain-containing protein [Acidobacteriota bacterium]
MKKIVFGLVCAKLAFLSIMFAAACQTAQLSPLENTAAMATPTPVVPNDNINRPTSEPYKGDLSIFEDENRAKNLQIERVMDILKIKDGKTVADIGAGSGWFTVRAAKRVGAGGKVFAVEINPDAITYINDRAKKENLPNIQTILGTEDDAKLSADSIDAVMILKTYHEIAQPVKLFEKLRPALKKDALVGIIDRSGDGTDHGLNKEVVIDEMKRAGFKKVDDYDFTKADGQDYFLVFRAAK